MTWSSNYVRTRNEIDQMFVRCHWTSFAIDCRGFVGVQTGIELGSDHAMVRARQRLRIKAAHLSNRPARGDTAKLKTKVLDKYLIKLQNRLEGLGLRWDDSPEDEWRRGHGSFLRLPRNNVPRRSEAGLIPPVAPQLRRDHFNWRCRLTRPRMNAGQQNHSLLLQT